MARKVAIVNANEPSRARFRPVIPEGEEPAYASSPAAQRGFILAMQRIYATALRGSLLRKIID
ncbi:MAG: hypothetical protein E5X19_21300 [Mesorhizobium sp.]|nr:MAG: hypothetical protein E5X19_21300 [Mesorhizobium sp.]